MRGSTVFLMVLAASCAAGGAHAATSNAVFGATVGNTCRLIAVDTGLLVPNVTNRVLSSSLSGGRQAQVSADASSAGFTVSAIAPTTFVTGNSNNTTFASTYSLSGATSGSNIAGPTQTLLNSGSSTVAVDLSATKTAGVFPRDMYTADVTIRCE